MKRKGEKLPPFTAIFRHTTKSAAWTALSVSARATFFEMQSNYNTKAQNAVFLSARDGARKLGGVCKDTVMRWQRELEYYGFIIKVQGAHLGLNGVGKAALYRLTDRHYAGQPPTYEFLNWDGEIFHEQKRPSYYQAKKQNPVRAWRTPRPSVEDIRETADMTKSDQKCPSVEDISNAQGCPSVEDISSLTSSLLPSASLPPTAAFLDLSDPIVVAAQRERLNDLSKRLARFEPVRAAAE
jgi:hypothetical protein